MQLPSDFFCERVGLITDIRALAAESGLDVNRADGTAKTDEELCQNLRDNANNILWQMEDDDGQPYQGRDGRTWIRMHWKYFRGYDDGWDHLPAVKRFYIWNTIGEPEMYTGIKLDDNGKPVLDEFGNEIEQTVSVIRVTWDGYPDRVFFEQVDGIRAGYDGNTFFYNGEPVTEPVDAAASQEKEPATTRGETQMPATTEPKTETKTTTETQKTAATAETTTETQKTAATAEKIVTTVKKAAKEMQKPESEPTPTSKQKETSRQPSAASAQQTPSAKRAAKKRKKTDDIVLQSGLSPSPPAAAFIIPVPQRPSVVEKEHRSDRPAFASTSAPSSPVYKRRRLPPTKTEDASVQVASALPTSFLPNETEFRLAAYQLIRSGQLALEQCDYVQNFADLRLIGGGTGPSNSFVTVGKIKIPRDVSDGSGGRIKNDILLKLAFDQMVPASNNSLDAERRIYRDVVNRLITNRHTPHVVAYYGELVCNQFWKTLRQIKDKDRHAKQIFQLLQKNGKKFEKNGYNLRRMRALITERSFGTSLGDFVFSTNGTRPATMATQRQVFREHFLPLLFQFFYTLVVFQEAGLQHNDLHTNNIFVDKTDKPNGELYKMDNRCYRHDSRYMIRIFDFDRSVKLPTEYNDVAVLNTALRNYYCNSFGQCEALNVRFELFRTMCGMYRANKRPGYVENVPLTEFIEFVVPRSLLQLQEKDRHADRRQGNIVFACILCFCEQDGCESCRIRNDPRIKLPQDVVKSEYFKIYLQTQCDENQLHMWQTPSSAANKKQ